METPPSVSSDVNCVRGNKTRCQIAPKHNLQASCEVKQRQSTVFASQGKVPMAGMEEQQLSSTGCTHQCLWELFVQQLQGWADCPLTKTGRAGPGQETAPRVQLCSNSRFPLIAGDEAHLPWSALPSSSPTAARSSSTGRQHKPNPTSAAHPSIQNICRC